MQRKNKRKRERKVGNEKHGEKEGNKKGKHEREAGRRKEEGVHRRLGGLGEAESGISSSRCRW